MHTPSKDVENEVIVWLLGSDPAVKWQAMRDLLEAPESDWSMERRKVETEGWGSSLLSHQDDDGQWAGGAFFPRDFEASEWKAAGQPWTATYHSLTQLRILGLDPASAPAQKTVALVGKNSRWEEGGQPYWEGETEECINGQVVAQGAYFGADVSPVVERLLRQRMEDGGWNCERDKGSVRSSFATTINVLEGLLEYERATGNQAATVEARKSGEEYLLKRHLFRRLSTGEQADEQFLQLLYPNRWQYDVLRALNYFRAAASVTGTAPDPRLKEAIEHLCSKRREDGRWNLDRQLRGRTWLDLECEGQPSPMITLWAMRVLKWWDSA